MAQVNFFGRLSNLWKGFINLWVEDMEKKHPEIAYENAVQSMTEKYVRLKKATAAIIRRREELQTRLQEEKKQLEQIKKDLETAIETDQADLGVILIQKRKALTAEVDSLVVELEEANGESEDAKASLMSVKAEIDRLREEKDRMLAKMENAQARIKIQEQIEGLSVDAEVQALENVRSHIKNLVAEAKLNKEIQNTDMDTKLAALRKEGAKMTARNEFEEMKKARAAKAAKTKNM